MIRIVTDSTSDLSLERMSELKIDIAPLSVRFGEEVFQTLYEITNEEFFDKMADSEEMPSTMQVNPAQFEELFHKYIKAGDEIIVITIGAKLSGTCQSAVIASNEFEEGRIAIIDSKTASGGLALLVEQAARMRDNGKSFTEIVEAIHELVKVTKTYVILENLDFLRHGGRISPEEYVAGEKLGIKPVVQIEGIVKVVDKVKGKKGTNRFVMERLEEFDLQENSVIHVFHGNAPELADSVVELLRDKGYKNEVRNFCTGSIIGAHLGANCVGIAFAAKS